MNYAVIMAGGCGSRLWPLSRESKPKQVLDIFGSESLLGKSFKRLLPIFAPEQIYVQTGKQHIQAVRDTLAELPPENIIAEPDIRNTAGAIGLAATVLTAKDPNAVMAVVTADQIIEPIEIFAATIEKAINFVNANPEALVTFGINPSFAATQYGYIHLAKPVFFEGNAETVFKVGSFREKPDLETAQRYLEAQTYYWNSGMFVWNARKILNEIFITVPGSAEPLCKISEAVNTDDFERILAEEFVKVPKISIDYAVMEKSSEVYALKMDSKWFDMGSYQSLADVLGLDANGNNISCEQLELVDCKDNIIVSTQKQGHLVAAIGLRDMIIANTDDVTLICPKENAGKIKDLIDKIRKEKGDEFL